MAGKLQSAQDAWDSAPCNPEAVVEIHRDAPAINEVERLAQLSIYEFEKTAESPEKLQAQILRTQREEKAQRVHYMAELPQPAFDQLAESEEKTLAHNLREFEKIPLMDKSPATLYVRSEERAIRKVCDLLKISRLSGTSSEIETMIEAAAEFYISNLNNNLYYIESPKTLKAQVELAIRNLKMYPLEIIYSLIYIKKLFAIKDIRPLKINTLENQQHLFLCACVIAKLVLRDRLELSVRDVITILDKLEYRVTPTPSEVLAFINDDFMLFLRLAKDFSECIKQTKTMLRQKADVEMDFKLTKYLKRLSMMGEPR